MGTAIAIQGLGVRRGRTQVISDLSASIPAGKIVGLLGPSGAGKTTLMRAIMGVQSGVTGIVSVLGEPAGSRALSRRVAYDTQSSSVFDDMTVVENLDYMRRVLGLGKTVVGETIAQVDLSGLEKHYVRHLSGGQRNRVSLAMALLSNPDLLILDEPTVGLDPVLRNELWALFHRLAESGKTLIVSSHVMDEAERCDTIMFMRNGQLIADGPVGEILKSTGTSSAEDAFLVLAEAGGVS